MLGCRVFQAHDDWVEGLLVCEQADCQEVPDQAFFSYSADGHVCSWDLDTEQNCDVYRLKVLIRAHDLMQVPMHAMNLGITIPSAWLTVEER